ncbi:MAG: 3-hydroxybutyryl-CoA dehydrogenase [Clostridiaceae bacterium]|nr:3-hydroxybutyryl-CoA dehydrogenase [Clostridiaceae bacterium]
MKVCVFGAGMMGAGIAQVFLTAGHEVVLADVQQPFVDSGELRIYKGLDFLEDKGKITPEFKKDCHRRLVTTIDKDLAADADFVMEVIVERMDIKKSLLKELDKICPEKTIFASNTSAMSITEMAAAIPHRSHKFVGCHFFNPAPVMKLVEVVRAIQTSDETFNFAFELMKSIGKTPIKVEEGPGFVVNRMLIPMMNEAISIYADGLASAHDIDRAMQLGAGMRSGPLHTADLVGHDVNLAIMETIHNETGDPRYRPHPLLRKMVRAGWLGIKTGKGFFTYDRNGKEIIEESEEEKK